MKKTLYLPLEFARHAGRKGLNRGLDPPRSRLWRTGGSGGAAGSERREPPEQQGERPGHHQA